MAAGRKDGAGGGAAEGTAEGIAAAESIAAKAAAAGIPGWGTSPRGQIMVPTGKGIPNVQGTNLPRLAGSQDSYYAWVSNASMVPADNKFTIMTGKDQDDMTDMERKVRERGGRTGPE